jgi:hypothetical protein
MTKVVAASLVDVVAFFFFIVALSPLSRPATPAIAIPQQCELLA